MGIYKIINQLDIIMEEIVEENISELKQKQVDQQSLI